MTKYINEISTEQISSVSSTSVNPGYTLSDLQNENSSIFSNYFLAKNPSESARQIVYAIVKPIAYKGYLSNFLPEKICTFSYIDNYQFAKKLWNNGEFKSITF